MYNKMNWSGTFLHGVKFRFQKSTNLAKCRRSHFNVLSEKVTPVSHTNDEVSNGDFASANRVKFNNKSLKTAQRVFVENCRKESSSLFQNYESKIQTSLRIALACLIQNQNHRWQSSSVSSPCGRASHSVCLKC